MSGNKKEMLVVISGDDLSAFQAIVKKIEDTNIFPHVLQEDGFVKAGDSLYSKASEYHESSDQSIQVFNENGKWQYKNLNNDGDKGNLIQFIANRWSTPFPLINNDSVTIILAAKVANTYFNDYLKALKKEVKEKPAKRATSARKKRSR
ncbi:hypothetical protein [Olivibacter domesticus]|uniref:Uncharacterized protein n=1 Tax=Olivibacter domesticus TaxID=407022 RepID=A0A1H7IF17_OLID1|nr:hypothetical protein [Olivibacter domesticus]SEK61049.1 hypothetical protein SAMN05661044_00680 [Olivibacter domesticus]